MGALPKAFEYTFFIFGPMYTVFSFVHSLNDDAPTEVTDGGRIMFVRLEHPAKAHEPTEVRKSSSFTSVKALQSWNVFSGSDLIPQGICIAFSARHP